MKCRWCVAEGARSTITPLGGSTTLMGWSPYYDEDGVYHTHDPNKHSYKYRCSRGHQWWGAYKPCVSCDWGVTEDVLIVTPESNKTVAKIQTVDITLDDGTTRKVSSIPCA